MSDHLLDQMKEDPSLKILINLNTILDLNLFNDLLAITYPIFRRYFLKEGYIPSENFPMRVMVNYTNIFYLELYDYKLKSVASVPIPESKLRSFLRKIPVEDLDVIQESELRRFLRENFPSEL